MDLITLSPRIDIAPMQRLRSPGNVLLHDYLDPMAMSAALLARRTGIPARVLKESVNGSHRITANNALRLAAVLGTTGFYWMALQARYDLEAEWAKHRVTATRVG